MSTLNEQQQIASTASSKVVLQPSAYNPQLAHLKNQWNAQCNIPQVTVQQKLQEQQSNRSTPVPVSKLATRLLQPSPEIVVPPTTLVDSNVGIVQPPPSPQHVRQQANVSVTNVPLD